MYQYQTNRETKTYYEHMQRLPEPLSVTHTRQPGITISLDDNSSSHQWPLMPDSSSAIHNNKIRTDEHP